MMLSLVTRPPGRVLERPQQEKSMSQFGAEKFTTRSREAIEDRKSVV